MATTKSPTSSTKEKSFIKAVKDDYYLCVMSREASLLGRKEVLTGKAKFGILGDGKELPQVAMARAFKKGDWRSGYYRDQTFMMAIGACSVEEYFAQLYADAENDPFSGGRQMNAHFATPTINQNDEWLDLVSTYNSSSDISCTGGQMARSLGLAMASKKYKTVGDFEGKQKHSNQGNEVVFCTIGDASTSEGVFWETMNAATVNRVPLLVAVWDDGYGISVPKDKQTTKSSISKSLEGFLVDETDEGILIFTVKGWDYPHLCAVFEKAAHLVRKESRPALVHVEEVTQPQGHSTSGSHERYKSEERLSWEGEFDCIKKMEEWILTNDLVTKEELDSIHEKAIKDAREGKRNAWDKYYSKVKQKSTDLSSIYDAISKNEELELLHKDLKNLITPTYNEVVQNARRLKYALVRYQINIPDALISFLDEANENAESRYHTHLFSQAESSALNVPVVHPIYSEDSKKINGYQVLNRFFDSKLSEYNNLYAFGEDVGKIGDVNQGFAGMQEKYGEHRVFDTGIHEWSIMGMAIGMAMRGLRPIAEIQYLDYLIYGMSALSDDLATLRYRSNGIQMSPAIIRTRGHRLEGIWHAGSPMGMLLNSLRGIYIITPRNMVQAAGFYNTMLQSTDPALIIECLNGYRLKETLPDNFESFTVPLGVPEILQEGSDITLVTYGSCVRVAQEGIKMLEKAGISVELIDVQTLLPFDLEHIIVRSLEKTNKILFVDEDVPGGATAYMMQEVLEKQGGYKYLDAAPVTLTAKSHRPPFGSDGDYFSKPNAENVYEVVLSMMKETDVHRFHWA